MSKPFSIRSWLTRRCGRRIVKNNVLAEKIACRLRLETLEDRLPTGDLLGAAMPSILNLIPHPVHHPAPAKTKAPAVVHPADAPKPAPSHGSTLLNESKESSSSSKNAAAAAAAPAAAPAETEEARAIKSNAPASPTTTPTAPATGGSSGNPLQGSSPGASGTGPSSTPGNPTGSPSPSGGGSSGNSGSGSGSSGGGGGAISGGGPGSASVTNVLNAGGNSVVNQITGDNRPVVVGTGQPGASITVYADGHSVGKVTADNNGLWSMQVPQALPNGLAAFNAAQTGRSTSPAGRMTTTIYTKPPTVTVTAPLFADSQVAPTVTVNVSNDPYGYNPVIQYDVDLNHDGKFTDPGDEDFAVGGLSENLWNLPQGTYTIRVRVTDTLGNVGVGYTTMQVDPNAGFVADQNLLELATGWYNSPYMNNPQLMPGAWGIVPATGQDVSNGGGGSSGGGAGGSAGLGSPGGAGSVLGMPYNPNNPAPNNPDAVNPLTLFFINSQGQGEVEIDARVTLMRYYSAFQKELEKLGMTINLRTPSSNMVTGYLPIDEITALDNLPYFNAAVAELRPSLKVANVSEFQASPIILAPEFRASQGVNGAGVKVGILSDSVNEYEGGLSQSYASGTLVPGSVQVLQDDPSGTGTDEGRAMLEIVHNVAPGASLAFATGDISAPSFAANILALAAAGSKVIADDIGYFDEPMFSVGRIGQAVDQVESEGVVYATAAGNVGNSGYRAAWNPITTTVGGTTGVYQNFGGSALEPFTLAPGDSISLSFCWSAAYLEGGSSLPNFQVPQNVIVDVVDTVTGKILQTFNAGGQNIDEAFQDVEFLNGSNDSQLAFAFQLTKGPAPQAIGWVLQGIDSNVGATDINALDEGASTLQGHTLANGAITVGAVPYTNPTQPEPFSTLGGSVQLFSNPAGVPYAAYTTINKPNVVAPDGVTVSFDLDGQPSFFGTSAATPNVAGAAALLLQQAPDATPSEVANHIGLTAEPLLTGGFNAKTGDGLLQLNSPLQLNATSSFNNTSDTAINYGTIGSSKLLINAYVENGPNQWADLNWFVFTAGVSGSPNIQLDDDGLEVHLFSYSNGFLTPVGTPQTSPFSFMQSPTFESNGITTIGSGTYFPAGSLVYVEVKGVPLTPDSWTSGQYNLIVSMNPT